MQPTDHAKSWAVETRRGERDLIFTPRKSAGPVNLPRIASVKKLYRLFRFSGVVEVAGVLGRMLIVGLEDTIIRTL